MIEDEDRINSVIQEFWFGGTGRFVADYKNKWQLLWWVVTKLRGFEHNMVNGDDIHLFSSYIDEINIALKHKNRNKVWLSVFGAIEVLNKSHVFDVPSKIKDMKYSQLKSRYEYLLSKGEGYCKSRQSEMNRIKSAMSFIEMTEDVLEEIK